MRSKTYKTEGIILHRINAGEADRIITVFSRHYGKIRCIAKGVRKPTSRKSGHIELFDNTILYIARGRNLDILTQAEVMERFSSIRDDLKASKAAYHVVEIVNLLVPEEQENPGVFDHVLNTLRLIDGQKYATRAQIIRFEKSLLQMLGFGTPRDNTAEKIVDYIESIVEKKLTTINIFKDV